MTEKGLHGVLLDLDGTLIDSNARPTRAWIVALAPAGLDAPPHGSVRRRS